MKILGIDTSSKFLSIALSEGKDIISEQLHLADRRHSSLLVPSIKEMLKRSNLSIKSIDAFVVGLGPGSFTGLRIGVSAIKGFGIATKKPCIGISSMDALVLNTLSCCLSWSGTSSRQEEKPVSIVPIIDAKRGQIYCAIYKEAKGEIVRKSDYFLLSINRLVERLKGPAVFLGDGILFYRKEIQRLNKKAVFLSEDYWYPRAENLIKFALRKPRRFKDANLSTLRPIYLYPEDCQVKLKK